MRTISAGEYYKTSEAARLFGMSADNLRQRRFREGDKHPRHIALGSECLYSKVEIERAIANGYGSKQ